MFSAPLSLNELFAVSAVVNGVTSFAIGIVATSSGVRSKSVWIFSAYMLAVSIWSLGYYFWMSARTDSSAFTWITVLNVGSAFIPITYYHWVTIVAGLRRKLFIAIGYAIALFCVWASFTPFYVASLSDIAGLTRWPHAGPLYIVYLALYLSCSIFGIIEIARLLIKRRTAKEESRTLVYLLVVLILGLLATTNFPLWYGIPILPWGNIFVFLHVFSLGYAMMRHDLMRMSSVAPRLATSFIIVGALLNMLMSETVTQTVLRFLILIIVAFFSWMFLNTFNRVEEARTKVQELAKRLSETNWELSKRNEQLRIIDQRKSEFVSIASHQLRTPVTAIKGYASLILENSFGDISIPVRGAVERIFTSSNRLANMINDFLNISKIEQGTMTYQFTDVDLRKMVQELVQEFLVAAGEKKIDLATEIPKEGRFIVKADEGKIRQILSNLIDNAIKYTPKGSVRVILEKEPNRGKHGTILLKVKDTGVGLSHDDLHHLFGKFARGSEGQKLNTAGSGLGLYVAKKMLEAHKGTVWVDSEGQGKGSVFCIELPDSAEELPSKP